MGYSCLKMESWIHNFIRKALYVHDGPAAITRDQMEIYHLVSLQRILHYAYAKSDFYRRHFDDNNFRPEHCKCIDDLAKIPFTEQESLHFEPYKFLCISTSEVERVVTFSTSGTTGRQKKVFFSGNDLDNMKNFMAAGLSNLIGEGDAVVILLPDSGPYGQARLLAEGARLIGAIPVIASAAEEVWEQLQLIREVRPRMVFGSTDGVYRVTQAGKLSCDLSEIGVRVVYVTSDFVSETLRKNMENAWGAEVYVHYGMTEMGLGVAVECPVHDGYHFNEKDLLLEVVDPQSGEPVGFGQEGELVFTTLRRQAMPLIRYRTHDVAKVTCEPCECGVSSLLKIGRVYKRLESVVELGQGVNIYPGMFDEVVYQVPEVVDYQITVNGEVEGEIFDLAVEVTQDRTDLPQDIIERICSVACVQDLLDRRMLRIGEIVLLPPGGLKRGVRAKKIIEDKRFPNSNPCDEKKKMRSYSRKGGSYGRL